MSTTSQKIRWEQGERLVPEEMWEQLRRLIYKVCHTFKNRHGGHFEDILSEAYPHYVSAVRSWSPSKGPLEKRITFVIWNMLTQTRAKEWQRHNRLPTEEHEEGDLLDRHSSFDLDKFIEELDQDAQNTIKVVLDFSEMGKVQSREEVVNYLIDKGWDPDRIVSLWNKVREALEER